MGLGLDARVVGNFEQELAMALVHLENGDGDGGGDGGGDGYDNSLPCKTRSSVAL